MQILTLFFLLVQFYNLLNNRRIYYILQKIIGLIQEQQQNPEVQKVVLVNASSLTFLFYMVSDLLYLLFCFWLLFTDAYWQQGGILFLLTSLETYAFHARVAYTFDEAENGYIYPKIWLRCLFSGFSIYILTRLYVSL